MKVKLLRKLRKKYSKGYKIIRCGSCYRIIYEDCVFSLGTTKSKEEALKKIHAHIRYNIEEYIKNTLVRELRSRNVTYKMLYG